MILEFLLPQFANNQLPNGLTVHGFGQDGNHELYALVTNTPANGRKAVAGARWFGQQYVAQVLESPVRVPTEPEEPRAMSPSHDPIDFELFKNAIFSIADEMALTV